MFDFNKVNIDIENNQSLEDISKYVIWDTMLMSKKLKYLLNINNFAAIMKHGDLLKVDSPNKVSVNINIYKAIRQKQFDFLATIYYRICYVSKAYEVLNSSEGLTIIMFKLLDSITIKYTYSSNNNSDLYTTTYEIIETDYEKLKINLFYTQTFLKN